MSPEAKRRCTEGLFVARVDFAVSFFNVVSFQQNYEFGEKH